MLSTEALKIIHVELLAPILTQMPTNDRASAAVIGMDTCTVSAASASWTQHSLQSQRDECIQFCWACHSGKSFS